jgi:hypothetical protein
LYAGGEGSSGFRTDYWGSWISDAVNSEAEAPLWLDFCALGFHVPRERISERENAIEMFRCTHFNTVNIKIKEFEFLWKIKRQDLAF